MMPFSIVHQVGIGDFINCESFLSPERKAALQAVYTWDGDGMYGNESLKALMRATPDFAHVEFLPLTHPTQRPVGSVPTMRDHAISHRLRYHGSSFLKGTLAEVPFDLPERYVFIQPDTPKNGARCPRFLADEEWDHVVKTLMDWYAVGIVVNAPGGKSRIPRHPLILDRTGLTTMPESVELLKGALGYIGIDSNFAILAAQLFPDRMKVKCNNPYLYENPWWTYPPLQDSSFLYPRLGGPPHAPVTREPIRDAVLMDLRCNALIGNRVHIGGARVEVGREKADEMIGCGQAIEVADPEV